MNRRISATVAVLAACALAGCASRNTVNANLLISGIFAQRPELSDRLVGDRLFVRALQAETTLARRDFVPRRAKPYAGVDLPLDIGWAQTISDPYIVAVMTAASRAQRGSRILEIGTGSGYQAAVLSRLGARVSTIEIVPQLARRAAQTLRRLGMLDVATRQGDGFQGWAERAPFDAIIVTAGAAEVPGPLLAQLAPGGTLVMPIGPSTFQEQIEVLRMGSDKRVTRCTLGPASFVPLTGRGQAPAHLRGLMEDGIPLCYAEPVT